MTDLVLLFLFYDWHWSELDSQVSAISLFRTVLVKEGKNTHNSNTNTVPTSEVAALYEVHFVEEEDRNTKYYREDIDPQVVVKSMRGFFMVSMCGERKDKQ